MSQIQKPSAQRTMEQIRGQEAWDDISELRDKDHRNEYGTLVRGLPAMIQTNGLAATIAFLRSKPDKKAHQALVRHLEGRIKRYLKAPDHQSLMVFIQQTSTDQYRRATVELMAYAGWLKRYAEAEGWKSSEDGG